jgi:hypothetical protein
VVANGGSVSASTMKAVSKFCGDIGAAGLRDRFYRLNLFAGTGLTAALVPIYRGQSFGGTSYGDATDTNVNFVGGDYVATTGLTGGTGKYLTCGTGISSALTPANCHQMVYGDSLNLGDSTSAIVMGTSTAGFANRFYLQTRGSSLPGLRFDSGSVSAGNVALTSGMVVGTAISSTDLRLFVDGTQQGITVTNDRGSSPHEALNLPVFAGANTAPGLICKGRLVGYSVGLGLTGAQVTSFRSAYQTLIAALGRTV